MLRREERLKVLEMIEAGKIGVEEGMRLMKALEQAGGSEDPPAADPSGAALSRQLDAFTGFEFIRVEEQASRKGKSSLVVIGID